MLAKICVMGDGGVGKTCSTIQYVANHFVEMYDPTIEDSYKKHVVVDDKQFLVEILDTAGQDDFSPLRDSWIRESEAFLLIYSVTSKTSLEYLDDVLRQIHRTKEEDFFKKPVPIVLAGNKCDLLNREVEFAEAQAWAKQRDIEYVTEFSAKSRMNLTETFNAIIRQIGTKNGAFDEKKQKKKRAQQCNIL